MQKTMENLRYLHLIISDIPNMMNFYIKYV